MAMTSFCSPEKATDLSHPRGDDAKEGNVERISFAQLVASFRTFTPEEKAAQYAHLPRIIRDLSAECMTLEEMSMEEADRYRLENGMTVEVDDGKLVPPPADSFAKAFGVHRELMRMFSSNGFAAPTPIQAQMWPILLRGDDCVGISQTGSGKSLAFILPALLHLYAQRKAAGVVKLGYVCVLVLSPTHELAQQLIVQFKKYSFQRITSACLYGGGNRPAQIAACEEKPEVVVATPGRLFDLMNNGYLKLDTVSFVVLDEADRMLDLGFEPQIRSILCDIRPDRINTLTSATWPEAVRRLTTKYTTNPFLVVVGSLDLRACKDVLQHVEFMNDEEKLEHLLDVISGFGYNEKVLIFVDRKLMADHVASELCLKSVRCEAFHSGRGQAEREDTMQRFLDGRVRVLVATDVAARGLDVPDVNYVINYDFPTDIGEYVHRVGRTGRAGRRGASITFMTFRDRKHAANLIEILEKSDQFVDGKLRSMAEKWQNRPSFRPQNRGNGNDFDFVVR